MVFILEVFDGDANDVFGRVRFGRGHCENDGEGVEKNDRREGWFAAGRGVVSVGRVSRAVGVNVRPARCWFSLSFPLVFYVVRSFVRSLGYFVRFFPRTDKLFLSLVMIKSQYKGVELQADKPLSESGVPEKDESDMSGENGVPIIVAVRKHLVAEGWKMVHNDAMDSDTEEDDF